MKIVLASNNAGKLAELQAMFAPLGCALVRQSELGVPEAPEPYRTFVENALAKARNAAISGDKPGFETTLKEAAAIWPNNPELAEVAAKAFAQGDQMAQTLIELDQLIAQKNLRRIAEEAGRFLAATQTAPPEKQATLKKILEEVAVEEEVVDAVIPLKIPEISIPDENTAPILSYREEQKKRRENLTPKIGNFPAPIAPPSVRGRQSFVWATSAGSVAECLSFRA